MSGSRIRLRLDGTDDRNDFWLMVDSDLIHPYGYTSKQNRKIQPPLGYGNDISKWPRFLEKIISTATTNGSFADETCFKPVPTKPPRNEFKLGQKLEAVDPKNPHLICPATVKETKRDKLLITFDGWSHSSDFWCSFTSRDLFPVGFCAKSAHILQFPGNLVDKKPNVNNTSVQMSKSLLAESASTVTNPPEATKSPNQLPGKTRKSSSKSSPENNKKFKNNNDSANSSLLNVTDTLVNESTNNNNNNTQTATNTHLEDNNNENKSNGIDLSLVKVEAVEPDETSNNSHLKSVSLNIDLNSKPLSKSKQINTIVYLIPGGDCGKYIKTDKFHSSHTKFGPGTPSTVYKSILQSLVDCAVNRYEVFKLIPVGKSNDYVRLKNNNYNERKTLTNIESVADLWTNVKSVCQLLEIDDSLVFSRTKINTHASARKKHSDSNKTEPASASSALAAAANVLPLTPQPSSSSSASSSASTSSSLDQPTTTIDEPKTINSKRRSTVNSNPNDDASTPASNDSPSKLLKLDKSLVSVQVSDWSVEQVVYYIYQLNDSNFSSYIEMFRHHVSLNAF